MATRFLLFCLLCLPVFSAAQVVDTAAVRREVDSLVALNRSLVGASNFEEALRVIEVADSMALLAFGKNSALYATCLFNHGQVFCNKNEYEKAEMMFLEALGICEKISGKKSNNYAMKLKSLADVYLIKADYDKAETSYLEAKSILENTIGIENIEFSMLINNLGILYRIIGNYEQAESLSLQDISIKRKILGKEDLMYAKSLATLGGIYCYKSDYDKAEPLLLESMGIIEKLEGKESANYASGLNLVADLYYDKGNFDQAEKMYLKSMIIKAKVLGIEHPDYALSLNNLSLVYWKKGNYNTAEIFSLTSKDIYQRVFGNEHPYYANCLNNLANIYSDQGDYIRAEKLYLEAIAIFEKGGGKENPNYIESLNNVATFYHTIMNFDKAEILYLESLALHEKIFGKESIEYATGLLNLGSLYLDLRDLDKAESLSLKSRDLIKNLIGVENSIYALILFNLGEINFQKEEFNKSGILNLEALTIRKKIFGNEHPDFALNLNNLALVCRNLGQLKNSELYFNEATLVNRSILKKSAMYLPNQALEKHITLYQSRNESFYSFNHQTNSDSFRIASYNNALFYKGFALETSTHLEQAMQSAPDSIRDIHSRWKGYNRLLAAELALPIAERKHFAYLDSMSNVLEKALLRASSAFAEAQRQIEWQDVQKALKPGEAAIEFIHYRYSDKKETDSTMYSALLTLPNSKAPLFIPLCEARQLDALIYKANGTRANYLQNLYASTQSDGLPSLNQLIWSPMEKVLGENGIKTVYFAPTGLLHRLNLGALAEGKSGARLADRYKLVPMGSTRLLAEGQTQTEAGHIPLNNALIYGGVRYEMDSSAITKTNTQLGATAQDTTGGLFGFSNQTETQRGENWNYLPGTEKEARYLDGLLRRRNIHTTLRLGYEATEESFKQIGQNGPSPSLLHIGTHGFFFPDPQDTSRRRASLTGNEPVFKISEFSMIRSGLKLAGSRYAWENGHPLPGGHEDGILTSYEVSQMNLSNTQLVVLSACETGLGDIRGNEGVYGLQRAFRIAGAKNVLMSLWKVPDDATEKLMTRFYTHWLSEKKPLRESFEEAQKWLRGQKGFENPYFWAGFVLVGEL